MKVHLNFQNNFMTFQKKKKKCSVVNLILRRCLTTINKGDAPKLIVTIIIMMMMMMTRRDTKLGSYDEEKITLELLFRTPQEVSKWDGGKIDFSFLLSKDKDKDKIKRPIKNVDCYL